jgi:hypothetical protein
MHLHGSFACEARCPCRSGFSEEARIQAAKPWDQQKTPEDYLRKLLAETFGMNRFSPDYNDQMWINGVIPPVTTAEKTLRELVSSHFGVELQGPDYDNEIFDVGLPECKPAKAEYIAHDYIELNFEQMQVLIAIKYAMKSKKDYLQREGDTWKENAARANILIEQKKLEAYKLGIPQAQIDRFLEAEQ